MNRRERIEAALRGAFAPERLEVIDESHLHAGHAGARPEGETHYRVVVVAEAFRGMSRLERHRRVNDAVAAELASGLHALAVDARPPDGR